LPAKLPDRGYLVSYRVISMESRLLGGSFVFAVGKQGVAMTIPPPVDALTHDSGWLFLAGLDRVVFYVGLFIAGGGVMFHALVAGDLRRL
jgi:hypothetical protein